jgi:coenzyme F420-0:L-glutamate ligase/coenzyme F420-1:gamma-L-glutamate ligase
MLSKQVQISKVIRRKIEKARVARLATIDPDGAPHIVPICFAYDGRSFYSAVDRKPKRVAPDKLARLQHIRRESNVALLIDEYREDWERLWYVLVRGRAKLVSKSAGREHSKAIGLLKKKYAQYARGMLSDNAPIIRITAERISAWGKD